MRPHAGCMTLAKLSGNMYVRVEVELVLAKVDIAVIYCIVHQLAF